jgi:hypothetical protein
MKAKRAVIYGMVASDTGSVADRSPNKDAYDLRRPADPRFLNVVSGVLQLQVLIGSRGEALSGRVMLHMVDPRSMWLPGVRVGGWTLDRVVRFLKESERLMIPGR